MSLFSGEMAFFRSSPSQVVVGHGPFTRSADCPAGDAFYINDFALTQERPWLVPQRWEVLSSAEIERAETELQAEWHALDASRFAHVFQEITTALRHGVIEKTVPVVVENGQLLAGDGHGIATRFAQLSAPKIGYGLLSPRSGFAGATPEVLFEMHGLHLRTMALAGTARRDEHAMFSIDDKEIREHELVAQSLVAKLADLGTVRRHPRRILDLNPLIHYQSLIEVALHEPVRLERLLRLLHPTPALGPLPRTQESLSLLGNWRAALQCPAEFGAPFGLRWQDRFRVVVAIRGLWWEGQQLHLPAGCGVIEASRMVNEWRELHLKREAVKRAIQLHSSPPLSF